MRKWLLAAVAAITLGSSAYAAEHFFPIQKDWETYYGYELSLGCNPSALPQKIADRDPVQKIWIGLEYHKDRDTFSLMVTHSHYSGKISARAGEDGKYHVDNLDTNFWANSNAPEGTWNWYWNGHNKKNHDLYMIGIIIRDLNPGKYEWTYREYLKMHSDLKYQEQVTEASCEYVNNKSDRPQPDRGPTKPRGESF